MRTHAHTHARTHARTHTASKAHWKFMFIMIWGSEQRHWTKPVSDFTLTFKLDFVQNTSRPWQTGADVISKHSQRVCCDGGWLDWDAPGVCGTWGSWMALVRFLGRRWPLRFLLWGEFQWRASTPKKRMAPLSSPCQSRGTNVTPG